MTYSYHCGVDLGQARDYTAIAILEEHCYIHPILTHDRRLACEEVGLQGEIKAGWISPADVDPYVLPALLEFNREIGRPPNPPLELRYLDRLPLGTSYPAVSEYVGELLATPPLSETPTALIVDATGVGAGVVDIMDHAGLRPIPVMITGGDSVQSRAPLPGWRVPKRELIGSVQVLLQSGQLKIAEELPHAQTLRRELETFRVKVTSSANETYESWRERDHDDLVLAVAMAVWHRTWWNSNLDARAAYSVLEAEM